MHKVYTPDYLAVAHTPISKIQKTHATVNAILHCIYANHYKMVFSFRFNRIEQIDGWQ